MKETVFVRLTTHRCTKENKIGGTFLTEDAPNFIYIYSLTIPLLRNSLIDHFVGVRINLLDCSLQ